jgi:two-component system, NtrC family, sensor histidine kinase HydH
MLKKTLFIFGSIISLFLVWFALKDYRAAEPIAAENLRGLAFSLTEVIENSIQLDPSFRSLAGFHPSDVAFFAIIDQKGIYRFHSNSDLIGTPADDPKASVVVKNKSIFETRVLLGTGEKAYEFYSPLFLHNEVLVLQLALHTFRADAVIRRARLNLVLIVSLILAGWFLAAIIIRFAQREELHQQEMMRRENLARLGEMGAILAHEIRNPLAGIKGSAQIIKKKPTESRNEQFAESIVTEVRRLESLVNDLLVYARSDRYELTVLDPKELIEHTISIISQEAAQISVSISNECPEGLKVSGNRDRLCQVLLNLAINALQAMPSGGLLRFSVEKKRRSLKIVLSDSGQGISNEDMTRIFEPFFSTKARGTGLGLALCKKIIEEHNGTISIESTVGKGTTVSIIFHALPRGVEDVRTDPSDRRR